MDQAFYSAPHGNYSKHIFETITLSGVTASGTTTKVGDLPPGISIHKAQIKFGTVASVQTTTYDLGYRQRDQLGETAGTFTDDIDGLFDGTAAAASNALREATFIPPVLIGEDNIELVLTTRTAALVAASSIPMTIALEYTATGPG